MKIVLACLLVLPLGTVVHAQKPAAPARPGVDLRTLQSQARDLLGQNRVAEAVTHLRRAAQLGPLERDLAMRLAQEEIAAGRVAAAEAQLRSVAQRFDSVQALVQLARLRLVAGDARGARPPLEQARKLAPSSEEVLAACAQSWLALKSPERALQTLEALVRMYPTVAEYRHLRGVALLETGDAQAALEELREADRLDPRRVPTLVAIGKAENQRLRFGDAAAVLQQGLALDPENVDALAALARAEEGEGKLEEAEAHARRALGHDSAHGGANLVLGTILMKQGRHAEARDALERAVAAEPSAKAHYRLSVAYSRLGNEARARAERALYEKAIKEEEERLKALGRLGGMGTMGLIQ